MSQTLHREPPFFSHRSRRRGTPLLNFMKALFLGRHPSKAVPNHGWYRPWLYTIF